MNPSVFIGSSVEGLDVAYALQENLEYDAEVTVWRQGIFELSESTLDALINALDNSDFGIFVFTPDDVVKIRDKEYQAIRDNVLFELGLFVGRLDKKRNFVVIPRGQKNFHLPTDLLGLTPATYEPNRQDGNLNAALGTASNKIRRAFEKLGLIQKSQEHADLDDIPTLRYKLKDGNSSRIKAEAARALGEIGGPEVLSDLIDASKARSPGLKTAAFEAIEKIQSKSSVLPDQPVTSQKASDTDSSKLKEANSIPALRDEAKQLLIEASQDSRGRIFKIPYGSGIHISTHKRQFVEDGNARSQARWKAALEQLINEGLIEDLSYKGEVFMLTDEGYRVADILKMTSKD